MGLSPSSSPAAVYQSNWQVTLTPERVSILNFSPSLSFDPTLALSEIDLSANGTQSVNVLLTRYYAPPPGIPSLNSMPIYQYLQINLNNHQVPSVLQNANLIFKVNKSWISNNNITPNNVSAYKLDNLSDNKWIQILTIHNGSDNNFYYYQTNVSSFSYFAIGASVDRQVNDTKQNQVPALRKNKNLILFVLIIGALILVMIKKKKKESKDKNRTLL